MDVGAPSNFARILDLYDHSHTIISEKIKGFRYSDEEIKQTVKKVYEKYDYLCDPHGACGYQSLEDYLEEGEVGVFLETAHPAKFTETMEQIVGTGNIPLPQTLAAFMKGERKIYSINKIYTDFKDFLLNR